MKLGDLAVTFGSGAVFFQPGRQFLHGPVKLAPHRWRGVGPILLSIRRGSRGRFIFAGKAGRSGLGSFAGSFGFGLGFGLSYGFGRIGGLGCVFLCGKLAVLGARLGSSILDRRGFLGFLWLGFLWWLLVRSFDLLSGLSQR